MRYSPSAPSGVALFHSRSLGHRDGRARMREVIAPMRHDTLDALTSLRVPGRQAFNTVEPDLAARAESFCRGFEGSSSQS
jgi:hypothetical protein